MGIAASQATLLFLTRRIVDVEFQAERIQALKIDLSTRKNIVMENYLEALDAQALTYRTVNGQTIQANFSNLCGLSSIGNSLASSKKFVFRSSDDELIIPTDVYEGYEEYGGDDPYEFAMYMLGVDIGNTEGINGSPFDKAQEDYFNKKADSQSDYMRNLRSTIETKLNSLYNKTTSASNELDEEGKKHQIEDMMNDLLCGRWENFKGNFTEEALKDESLVKDLKILKEKMDEYKSKMYKGGAKDIYATATGTDPEDFDKEKFDYYLYWGKLIQMEEGLDGCANAGDYGAGFETDADALNNMLLYGQITIESVEVNKSTGKVEEPKITSVSSETALVYKDKSEVDGTELKKAEAEYNKALHEIQKQDKMYDLALTKLDTERQELTAEVESVKSIIKDAVDRTFKIFS